MNRRKKKKNIDSQGNVVSNKCCTKKKDVSSHFSLDFHSILHGRQLARSEVLLAFEVHLNRENQGKHLFFLFLRETSKAVLLFRVTTYAALVRSKANPVGCVWEVTYL